MSRFEYLRQKDLDNTLKILREDGIYPIAGGTNLLVDIRAGAIRPRTVVDIGFLPELRELAHQNGSIEIGSIEEGKKGDIVLTDTSGMEWHPDGDPVAHLVYSASGSSVSTVIINGKVIMRNRRLMSVDEDELRKKADESAENLKKRAGIKAPWKWPLE